MISPTLPILVKSLGHFLDSFIKVKMKILFASQVTCQWEAILTHKSFILRKEREKQKQKNKTKKMSSPDVGWENLTYGGTKESHLPHQLALAKTFQEQHQGWGADSALLTQQGAVRWGGWGAHICMFFLLSPSCQSRREDLLGCFHCLEPWGWR